MKKSQLLGAVCAAALVVLSNTAHAALVSQLLGLDIDGTLYDVTFHTDPGDSFMALWDADNDGVFGGGSSVFSTAPLFWGDQSGSLLASNAITAALGSIDWVVNGDFYDRILVPWGASVCSTGASTGLTTAVECIRQAGDSNVAAAVDNSTFLSITQEDFDRNDIRYASFAVSAVPVPAAVWLFGSGLLGLVGVARRKKAA